MEEGENLRRDVHRSSHIHGHSLQRKGSSGCNGRRETCDHLLERSPMRRPLAGAHG